MRETQVRSLGQENPLEKELLPTPVFLSGESHRQRSLAGYHSWGRKESDNWATKQKPYRKEAEHCHKFPGVSMCLSFLGRAQTNSHTEPCSLSSVLWASPSSTQGTHQVISWGISPSNWFSNNFNIIGGWRGEKGVSIEMLNEVEGVEMQPSNKHSNPVTQSEWTLVKNRDKVS